MSSSLCFQDTAAAFDEADPASFLSLNAAAIEALASASLGAEVWDFFSHDTVLKTCHVSPDNVYSRYSIF
jgi:hypothetical protein